MQTVGTKELKDRLTHYLRLVRQGTTVIVTDRGKPVGVLKPVSGEETGETEAGEKRSEGGPPVVRTLAEC